jgi:mRNA-degrading endonuclease RelE of RelBE toxin-antitoxin system
MNWAIELSASAIKQLKKLPSDRQAQIAHAIDEMESDPMAGDVIPLKGPEWKGRYRKRVGLTGSSSCLTARP